MKKLIFRYFLRPLKISAAFSMCNTLRPVMQKPLIAKYGTIFLRLEGVEDVSILYDMDTDKFYLYEKV